MKAFLALCVLSLSAAGLWAQQDMGVITGMVIDASGAAVPGAVVTNRDINEGRSTETGATGAYTTGPLRVGVYHVTVERPGFKKAVRPNVALHAQDRVRADFQLDVRGSYFTRMRYAAGSGSQISQI